MELYIENRENEGMILKSLQNGLLVWPTIVEEDGTTRTKKYEELSILEKLQADCDLKSTNIVLKGLPPDVYAVVNHHKVAKEIRDRVKLFMQGTKLSLQLKEWLLCNKFKGGKDKVMLVIAIMSKRPRNAAWFKEKAILAEVREVGKILDEEQLAFLTDLGIPDVLMANLSNYGLDVISEDKANQEKNNKSLTAELKRYKERDKTCEQRLNIDLSIREKMIDSQMDDMIKEKLALKQQIDSLEQNLSNQIKEKEYLLQTFTVFKSESKEKESKYIDKEIDLEKKIKELDNIVYKVGQSAQTVHMLTKPQIFYDTHKQALGYQNPFYLKKAQRIKPTLYDSSVISSQYVASPVIDDEENLILEENEFFLENGRLLQKIMSQDVTICVMNSTAVFDDVYLEMKSGESCVKCLDLDAELLPKQNGDRSQLMNFVSKFLGTVQFKNDQVTKIMGYRDYQLGNVIISSASWLIDVDTGESAISTTLGAEATGTREIALDGGLKYSLNMGWNKRSQSSLFGGLQDLKGITTRSGNAYQGPMIPTTSSSPPKVVERETEVTKDTMPPTNNGSTKDVQPSVV
nr:reverse transcriptase domain-containing protein [Tanacetum cinerariifolium]